MKRILVNGAGGFIGGHLVKRLKAEGCWVRAVDLKHHEFSASPADKFIIGDLRDPYRVEVQIARLSPRQRVLQHGSQFRDASPDAETPVGSK